MKFNGEKHCLWRAVDHEGEVLESFVSKRRDKEAALARGAALKILGVLDKREAGRWFNNRSENSRQPFRRRKWAPLRLR